MQTEWGWKEVIVFGVLVVASMGSLYLKLVNVDELMKLAGAFGLGALFPQVIRKS